MIPGQMMRKVMLVFGLSLGTAWIFSLCSAETPILKARTQGDVDAHELFDKNCATCHGKDGQAKTFKAKFNHARNLADTKWQAEVTDERIFNSISNGKGKMPAWSKKLSEPQINALVAYVRKLKQ